MACRFVWLGTPALLFLLTGPVHPQSVGFQGPISGFVYDPPSRMIRPLLGIPGATYLGPALLKDVDWASIAPGGTWAFVTRRGTGNFWGGVSQLAPTLTSLEGLIQAVDHVAWSSTGSYAVLYSSSANRLQRVSLTGSGPAADSPLDLSSWGNPATLAIDPTGQRIAFGVAGSGLYLLNVGQAPALISAMVQPGPMAFDGTGLCLYATDLGQSQIVEFASGSGPLAFAPLAPPNGDPVNPVGLAVSGGGSYLLLADSAGQAVQVYQIASQSLANTIPLASAPSGLVALSSAPYFLLNGGDTEVSLLILDARGTPSVFFVPAQREARR